MSIAPLLSEVSPRGGGLLADWWLIILLAVSLAAGVLAGVIPPRNVSGPDRIPPDRPAWPLLAVMFGAMGVYILAGSLYLTLKYEASGKPPATQPHEMTSVDTAVENTVPPLFAFLAMLLGDAAIREVCGQHLGLGLRRASKGFLWGLIGVVIVVPPLFLLMDVLEFVYRRLHYSHPTEHPLLHLLGERPPPSVVAAIVIGACIIAPLFEELLFRGHLQTLLRRMFHRMATRRHEPPLSAPPRGFPGITVQPAEDALPAGGFPVITAPPDDAPFPADDSPSPPTAVQTWAAVVVTSLVFASVHPVWSMPVIFVLALCLGYAYERTGNLWVPITIHAGFNTISTVIFLTGLYAR